MELRDDELKKILAGDIESPSFGFANKTLRLIKEKQAALTQKKEVVFNRWIMGGVLSFLAICILFSLKLEHKFNNINWQMPSTGLEVHWVVLMACLCLAAGLWIFILIEKKQSKANQMG